MTNMTFENQYSVASLYDGGWRAEDRDELIAEYDLTEEEADNICEGLREITEAKIADISDEDIANELDELIALGWTLKTFDEDYDNFDSDDDLMFSPENKERCREIFRRVWEYTRDQMQEYTTFYTVRDDVDISRLGDNVTSDMRWTEEEVEEDAENFGMTPEEFINEFLEEA